MGRVAANAYGEALMEVAKDKGNMQDMLDEAVALKDVLNKNGDFVTLLNSPKVESEEKKVILKNVFESRCSDEILSFLLLLIDKNRFVYVKDILDYFIARAKESLGMGTAYVTTAEALSQEDKDRVKARLLATTRYKDIEVIYDIDESLIAGVKVRIKDRVIDNTIRNKLDIMEKGLHDIQLS